MTLEQFWQLIEQSRAALSKGDDQIAFLEKALLALPPREMVSFEGRCWDLLSISFRRELWAAATIMDPGCSQGSFDAFRAWMVLEGKAFFDQAIAHPERLGDSVLPGTNPWRASGERLLQMVPHNYLKLTGEEMPTVPRQVPYVIKGQRWTESELPEMFPNLWRKFRT